MRKCIRNALEGVLRIIFLILHQTHVVATKNTRIETPL